MSKLNMACPECGAQMPVQLVKQDKRFSSHCYGCGLHMFGPAALLARLEHTDTVCLHKPEWKACKRGFTLWCPLCRVRAFCYQKPA
ncbi:MAG: hypothetical protein FJ023_08590 [Chloroflexi bacterium]|nr:hypothetical protein [Chloroflexota bacterium]